MGPGRSWCLVAFTFEGYRYHWSKYQNGYFNIVTQRLFKRVPEGATSTDSDWVLVDKVKEVDNLYEDTDSVKESD